MKRTYLILQIDNDSIFLWTALGGDEVLGAIRHDLVGAKTETKVFDKILYSFQGGEALARYEKNRK